ncbi:MAG: hypothetical protein ABSF33_21185, partial [Acidimicrobiales bacterium]
VGAALALLVGLLGSVAAAGPGTPVAAAATTKTVSAYWLVASDGGVFSFGGAGFYGSTGNIHLNKPVVGMAGTPTGQGYWLVASDGGIFAFGNAGFYGSTGGIVLNKPVVGMAPTPHGGGYWLVASDGGIFAFGDAGFYGSMGGHRLNKPVVGMAATPDGKGYWLVASDGGIFSFGDAAFYGSTGNLNLNKPIVGMTAAPSGHGYWFTASDGGVFAFGDAPFYGSLGNVPQSRPIVSITADHSGNGYWFTNTNGAVTAFGGAIYWGSAPQVLNEPVVGMAVADANGRFSGSSYPSGSYGYDISNFQCGNLPPSPHTIGLVEVVGDSYGSTNDCLGAEADWAGGGLNLYIYLTYGQATSSADPACQTTASPSACNFGFGAALNAFTKATAAGVNTSVGWWLDVEPDTPGVPQWSSNLGANAALVRGAIDGLHYEGLNGVGIYASPGDWTGIVGTGYSPAVPYWAADWDINPAVTCRNVHSLYAGLPRGPVQIVQYSSPSSPYPAGGMSTAFDNDYGC